MTDHLESATRRMDYIELDDGKKLALHGLSLRDYASLKSKALKSYRREMLEVWTENQDLVPEEHRKDLIKEAFEKAQQITTDDLPPKQVDGQSQEYTVWWMSADPDGQIFSIWLSAVKCPGQKDLSLDKLTEMFQSQSDEVGKILEAADMIGELSFGGAAKNSSAARHQNGRAAKTKKNRKKQRTG